MTKLLKMAIEFLDFRIKNGGSFHMLVIIPEATSTVEILPGFIGDHSKALAASPGSALGITERTRVSQRSNLSNHYVTTPFK